MDAIGSTAIEVWAGPTKLAGTLSSGLFILPADRLKAGYNNITARAIWENGSFQVGSAKVFRMSKPRFTYPTMTASGRLLTIRSRMIAPAEANGAKNFLVRIGVQRLVNGVWKTYMYKNVRANASTGNVAAQIRVKGAGKYRAFVYHSDLSHSTAMRTGTTLNVK